MLLPARLRPRRRRPRYQPGAAPKPHTVGSLQLLWRAGAEKRAAAAARRAQITETVQPLVPCKERAIAKAFSAGTKRIFLTGLPRFPKNCCSKL